MLAYTGSPFIHLQRVKHILIPFPEIPGRRELVKEAQRQGGRLVHES